MGRGSWTSIALLWQVTSPWPALVHSTSMPQVPHRNLLPSWLATTYPRS